ncbi:MAG: LamG-like jellyroll fold domain-containing protein [Mobilitalea sp.]
MIKKKAVSNLMTAVMLVTMMLSVFLTVEESQAADASSGLVARWTFDDNYNESVNGLTTTLGAEDLEYTEGVHGKAAKFNGKDNYLIVEANTKLDLCNSRTEDSNAFTISAWINLGDVTKEERYLLDKGMEAGWTKNDGCFWSNPYSVLFDGAEPTLILNNSFQDSISIPNIIQQGTSTTTGKSVEGEDWFLLTITYDGLRVKIYHDNKILLQNDDTTGFAFNEDNLFIGVDCTLHKYFKGKLDDLRIYARTLSYRDVDLLYQEGFGANQEFVKPTKQLVAYYAFDKNLKDRSIFENDAEVIDGGGAARYVLGEIGQAVALSEGNYIRIPPAAQLNFDKEFTISFWIKLKGEDAKYPIINRQNPSYGGVNNNSSVYQIYVQTWHKAEYTYLRMSTLAWNSSMWKPINGQAVDTNISYANNNIKSSSWFHITYAYKNGKMRTYLNGEIMDTTEKSDVANICNASGNLLIGYDGNTFLEGSIDELKIFNKCLTTEEIASEAERTD